MGGDAGRGGRVSRPLRDPLVGVPAEVLRKVMLPNRRDWAVVGTRMHAEPRCGPLPLADALIEWSDPELVQTVRKVETPFSAEELDALDTDFAERVTPAHRVLGPDPYPPFHPDPHIADLFEAWGKLAMAFALMALRGDVILLGIQTKPSIYPRTAMLHVAVQLPRLSVRSNTALQGDRFYSHMTARRAPPDPLDLFREDKAALSGGRGLELREALIAWGDLELVKAIRRIERHIVEVQRVSLKWPRLFEPAEAPAERCTLQVGEAVALAEKLGVAWKALQQSARRMIEREEWLVSGAQIWPERRTSRTQVPCVWAAEFFFDVDANKITVVQFGAAFQVYTAVLISRPSETGLGASAPDENNKTAVSEPMIASRDPTTSTASVTTHRRSATRGRKPDAAVVEAALHRHRKALDLESYLASGRTPKFTELARSLVRRMNVEKRADPTVRVPAEETVRKHVATIWHRLVGEKAAACKSAQ